MINELNKSQEDLMYKIVSEYEILVLSGDDSYDIDEIEKGVNFIYSLANLKCPQIVICNSPFEMAQDAGLKKGETFDYLGNGYDAGWTAFYDYMQQIGVEYDKESQFDKWKNFIKKSGVFATLLYEKVAFVCIRPCSIYRDSNDEMHCENGPAIVWRNGHCLYYLHGISMTEEQVMTPSNLMIPEMVMQETNVDVRRELIRKFGVDRLKTFGKLIDKRDDYELLDMSKIFLTVNYAPHLLMKNPSIGVWHLEGVGQECKTVSDAINWRAGNIKQEWNPALLT